MLQATALIFSGRPNPTWTIPEEMAATLAAAISALEQITPRPTEPPGLGYSGLVLVPTQGDSPGQWHFADGVIDPQSAPKAWVRKDVVRDWSDTAS